LPPSKRKNKKMGHDYNGASANIIKKNNQ